VPSIYNGESTEQWMCNRTKWNPYVTPYTKLKKNGLKTNEKPELNLLKENGESFMTCLLAI
jgi:hypothetical protein